MSKLITNLSGFIAISPNCFATLPQFGVHSHSMLTHYVLMSVILV